MATLMEALAFAARELDIFPIELGSKRPSISFIEQATRDPERIKLLWRDVLNGSKDYNIGVLCGNTLIIVDIDTKYDKRFARSALRNYESIGGHFNTLVVKTASGGYQAYFRLPIGKTFTNMQDIVPGVDIRCEHGYGIGPGSFSLESGGSYEIYVDKPIALIPDSIIPLLKPIKTRKERFNGHADSEKAIPLYIDYLERVAPAIEGQGGDAHTYNVACMGVRDYGLSEPTTTALMLTHFNPRCEPPWDADELRRKVENAEAYAIGDAGTRDPENILNGVTYTSVAAEPVKRAYSKEIEVTFLDTIPAINWLVYPMLVQREVTMVVGPGGVGKSMLLIALGCHVAVGRDFGQHRIVTPSDVLLYNPEDSKPIMSGRAACTSHAYNMDFDHVKEHFKVLSQDNDNLTLVDYADRKMFIPEKTIRFFSEYKEAHPSCKLIIVDPLRKMLRGINENDNAQMSEAMSHLNAFAYMLDISLIAAHHTAKNVMMRKDLDPDSPDLSVGAGSVVSSARIVINVLPQTAYDIEAQGRRNDFFSSRIAKNNHGPIGMLSWWQRRIANHGNGERYPVAIPANAQDATIAMHRSYIDAIGDHMMEFEKNALTVNQAALVVQEQYAADRTVRSTAELIRTIFKRGATTHPYTDIGSGQHYAMVLNIESDKRYTISLIETASRPLPEPAFKLPEFKEGEEEDDPNALAPPLA